MKKTIFMLIVMSSLSFFALAQKNTASHKIAVGLELGLSPNLSNGLTGTILQYEYLIGDSLRLTGSTGYVFSSGLGLGGGSTESIPLKIGVKRLINSTFYATAEAGMIFHFKTSNNRSLAFSPGIGLYLPVGNKSSIDLGLRYEGWTNRHESSSFFGLRLAYAFGL